MTKLKGQTGGKDFSGQFKKEEPRKMRLRNIHHFLDGRAYEECTVHLRADMNGVKRKPITGLLASFDVAKGLLITDRKKNKHYLMPNRGIIEMVEFKRRV